MSLSARCTLTSCSCLSFYTTSSIVIHIVHIYVFRSISYSHHICNWILYHTRIIFTSLLHCMASREHRLCMRGFPWCGSLATERVGMGQGGKPHQSGDSWMYPYQRTPMGNPYISPIYPYIVGFMGYYPQESLYKPYKYHGYTVRGTSNCPLNQHVCHESTGSI